MILAKFAEESLSNFFDDLTKFKVSLLIYEETS